MIEHQAGFRPEPLRIGSVLVDPPLILAPMAGVTDAVYRRVMARHGAGMVTTEMVSVQGIVRGQPRTWELCGLEDSLDVPLAVQLFGSDPYVIAEAARRVEAKGAAIIDINAGCPVKKVVKQGAGASLLRESGQLVRIVEEVRSAIRIPLTVKLRLGWDSASVEIVGLARRLEAAGADAITIHGRTAVQQYTGRADWSWIGKAKAALGIPVIGNGDVGSPSHANAMLAETSCDGIMIGRATRGNPWLLSVISTAWGRTGAKAPAVAWIDFYRTVREHVDEFRRMKPAGPGHFRKLLMWYSKGCPEGAPLRTRLAETDKHNEMLSIFREWVEMLAGQERPFLPVKVPDTGWDRGQAGGNSPSEEDESL
jgi:tRNA-dihydrouridine synthase B